MISSTRQAIACIFALFSIGAVAHAQTTPVKEPGATISGKVTLKGKGVAGIIVTLRSSERTSSGREFTGPKGITDDDGNYKIVNISPGSYRVIPASRAYVPAGEGDWQRFLIVNKAETIEHVDFALLRGGVITGKVVDSDGHPVVEESVYVMAGFENGNVYQQSYARTDDRGIYRLYGVRPGSYRVAAGRGEESFQSGVPRPFRRTYYPSVSDPLAATIVEVSEGSEVKDIDITFTRTVKTYTAKGRIVDGDTGQPIANVSYSTTRHEEKGSSSMSGGAVTNNRGEFTLPGLSPGKYSVSLMTAQDNDLRSEETRFEVTDEDVTGLVVKAFKAASISGVIVFEGAEEKSAQERARDVWVMAASDTRIAGSRSASARVAGDGSFQIRGVPSGTATFYAYSNGGTIEVDRVERDGVIQPRSGIVVKEREHITGLRLVVQFGNASLRGKIEVQNGTLPADARFYVWGRRLDEDVSPLYAGTTVRPQVDARGQFVLDGLTPGTYELVSGIFLTSAKVSYPAKNQQVVVTAGTTTNITITVDLSATPIKQQ